MVMPIYLYGTRVFGEPVHRVTQFDTRLAGLIRDMFETLNNGDGIGLAANQVGLPVSLLVMDLSDTDESGDEKPLVAINPEILESTGECTIEEGCLSIPGIRSEVVRAESVRARFTDGTFNLVEREFSGMMARVFQHEFDHLRNKFFVDRISAVRRQLLKPKLSRMRRGEAVVRYPVVSAADERKLRRQDQTGYEINV